MHDILLHKDTFARIADQLKTHEAAIRPVTLDEAGVFTAQWGAALDGDPEPVAAFGNVDVFFGGQAPLFMTTLLKTPRLAWFQSSAAGIEHPALVAMGQKAEVYTTSHAQAESMAEWAIWAAMDFLRRGPERRADQDAQQWQRRMSREICHSRWVIYGFGAIGAAVGRRVNALGGHVTGVRRSAGASEHADIIVKPDAIADALGAADVVLLCAPHTAETEGLANAAFFKAMRSDGLLMNLGRGALVDEAALVTALDAGDLAFAALDVVSEEPLPAGNVLWTHPKVMLTPHDSAMTEPTRHRQDQVFLDNLDLWLAGQTLNYVAPKSAFEPG